MGVGTGLSGGGRRIRSAIKVAAVALAGAVAFVDGPARIAGLGRAEWAVRVICASVVCLAIGVGAGRRMARRQAPRRPSEPVFTELSNDEILRYARQAFEHAAGIDGAKPKEDVRTLQLFADLLTERILLTEAREEVTIRGDFLFDTVSLEFALSTAATGVRAVVPVICRKGQEFLSCTVRGADGAPLARLPASLTHGYLALTLASLFEALTRSTSGRVPTADEQTAAFDLIRLICREDVLDDATVLELFDKAVAAVDLDGPLRRKLLGLCQYFGANTIFAVVAPLGLDPLRITFEDPLPPYDRLGTAHDRIRTWVGLRPYRYRIPLLYPFAADRYSLRVEWSPVQFVYQHWLGRSDRIGARALPEVWRPPPGADVALGVNAGRPHADVRTRGLNRADPQSVECVVEFEEIPPGALSQAAIISGVCTMLVTVFAFVLPAWPPGGAGIDLAALLLALPGFAATWVGQSAERVQQSSLTTYAGLACAGLVSLSSTMLFLVQSATGVRLPVAHARLLGLVGLPRFEWPWLAIAGLSLVATVVLGVRLRHRMSRYLRALRRRETPG